MPGMRGVNPRQMKQAMKRMGITTEDINGVEEVIIRTKDKEYVIKDAAVTVMEVQGQKTFQVIGEASVSPRSAAPAAKSGEVQLPEEDIELVMAQTGAGREQAVKALKESGGQPAEAILKIMSA
ncbi:MAG: nascent polypeptide-associated complex protein [Methanomassiliicoccus sp.]|nr:nascent polypeptide-associated complex protein [Methanomassiliicoccus sp.]